MEFAPGVCRLCNTGTGLRVWAAGLPRSMGSRLAIAQRCWLSLTSPGQARVRAYGTLRAARHEARRPGKCRALCGRSARANGPKQALEVAAKQPIHADVVAHRKRNEVASRQPSGERGFGVRQTALGSNQGYPRSDCLF